VAGLLLKQLVGSSFGHGAAWATLAEFAAVGGVAVLLSQWGFQAGPLVESLPVATVLEPLVAVALAGPLFAEHLAAGALAGSGQVLGGLTLVGGVLVLAWRTARREQIAVAPADRPSADRPSADRRVFVPAHRPPRPATATPLPDRRRTT
jgi:hypothetical protein